MQQRPGRLTGLSGMSQGIGLEVKPYVAAGWTRQTTLADPTSYPRELGFDLGYSITSSLRVAASFNTDFAEAEVDQRRVNLTRFPLRFPEQRDFFLEGSGVFRFAPANGWSPISAGASDFVAVTRFPYSSVPASVGRPGGTRLDSSRWERRTTWASEAKTSPWLE